MNFIGAKLADYVPADARVVKTQVFEIPDESGQPTGRTFVDEYLDLTGDETAEMQRHTFRDEHGTVVSTWYSVFGSPPRQFDAFRDGNGDGVIDAHWYTVALRTTDGYPWAFDTYDFRDQNFDGMPDRRTRTGSNGEMEWILEDLDFDGDYDVETKYSEGIKTTRAVNLDVAALE